MNKFKIGDKVRCLRNKGNGYLYTFYTIGKEYEVVMGNKVLSLKNDDGHICNFYEEDFELVEEKIIYKFKVGDGVRCIKYGLAYVHYGDEKVLEGKEVPDYISDNVIFPVNSGQCTGVFINTYPEYFELIEEKPTPKFKVGDKVRVLESYLCEIDVSTYSNKWTIQKIDTHWSILIRNNESLINERDWWISGTKLQLIEEEKLTPKFKVGDKVKCITTQKYGFIISISDIPAYNTSLIILDNDKGIGYKKHELELIEEKPESSHNGEIEKMGLPHTHDFTTGHNMDMSLNNPAITTNTFSTTKEFRIDELGWYKADDNNTYQVVYKINNSSFVFIDDHETPQIVYFDGSVDSFLYNLIEYLGPELPKEPRKFEFEGYLIEWKNKNLIEDSPFLLHKNIGHCCSNFYEKLPSSSNLEGGINSKWKVQMMEVLNETI